jgi:hypothetical protein
MVALATAFVQVRPVTDNFERDLTRQINKVDASKSAKKTGSGWGTAFGKAAVAMPNPTSTMVGAHSSHARNESS